MKKHWTALVALSILNALFVLKTGVYGAEQEDKTGGKTYFNATVKVKKTEADRQIREYKDKIRRLYGEVEDLRRKIDLLREEKLEFGRKLESALNDKKNSREELIEIVRKNEENQRKLHAVQNVFAGLYSGNTPPEAGEYAIQAVKDISEKSRSLAIRSTELLRALEPLIAKMKLSSIESAKLRYQIDEMKKASATLITYISPPEETNKRKCRILAVDEKLKTVIVDNGYMSGLRNGINLYAGKNIKLRVMMCRPLAAAAILVEGNFEEIVPGMEIRVFPEKNGQDK